MLWKVLKVKLKGSRFHAGPWLPTNFVPRAYWLNLWIRYLAPERQPDW